MPKRSQETLGSFLYIPAESNMPIAALADALEPPKRSSLYLSAAEGLGYVMWLKRLQEITYNEKRTILSRPALILGCGARTRTWDLVVMSHASCHCSTPRYTFGRITGKQKSVYIVADRGDGVNWLV